MEYIYILEEFRNINNKEKIYKKDTIEEVTKDRYDEIVTNMKEKDKKLIRKATKKEIAEYLNSAEIQKSESEEEEESTEIQKLESEEEEDLND